MRAYGSYVRRPAVPVPVSWTRAGVGVPGAIAAAVVPGVWGQQGRPGHALPKATAEVRDSRQKHTASLESGLRMGTWRPSSLPQTMARPRWGCRAGHGPGGHLPCCLKQHAPILPRSWRPEVLDQGVSQAELPLEALTVFFLLPLNSAGSRCCSLHLPAAGGPGTPLNSHCGVGEFRSGFLSPARGRAP